MKLSPRLAALTGAAAAGVIAAGTAAAVQAAPPGPAAPNPAQARAAAADSARALVANRPAYLQAGADDAFVQKPVISSEGTQYVPYERTYKGLPVVGGDFVLATDAAGRPQVRLGRPAAADRRPRHHARADPGRRRDHGARRSSRRSARVEGTTLVVYTLGAAPALAWETTVRGTGADGPSRLTVDVDARTGAVLRTQEHVVRRHRHRRLERPSPLTLNTTQSGSHVHA